MRDFRTTIPSRVSDAACAVLAALICASCSPRPGETVATHVVSSVESAPRDSVDFPTQLAAFMAMDATDREATRRRVAADLAAWREFEDVVRTRRDRRERGFYYAGLPWDRRQLGYGLVAARTRLLAVVKADPSAAEAWTGLARYSAEIGDAEGARIQLENALGAARARAAAGEEPADDLVPAIRRELAWVLRDLGLWDEGLAVAEEGLAGRPGDHDLLMVQGLLLAGAGRFDEAIARAARLPATGVRVRRGPQGKDLKKVSSDYASQWIRSQAYAAQGDLEMAFHVLGQDPDDTGRATYIGGGTQDRKLGTDTTMPRQVRFWNDVGLIAELLGADRAVDYYTKAWRECAYGGYYPSGPSASGPLVLDVPDAGIPYFSSFFGRHYLAGSRFGYVAALMNRMALAATAEARREAGDAALRQLDVLERRAVRPEICHALRGRIHYRREEWAAARLHLAQAHGRFAKSGRVDPRTSLLLGMIDLREERFAAAAVLFEESLGSDGSQAIGWRMLGVAYANIDRPEEALAAMDRALQLEPTSLAGRYNRGLLMLQLQRCREATADLELAVRLDPGNPDLLRLLQLAATCGREDEAGGTVVRATGTSPIRFEVDTDQLIGQLARELEGFFAPPDTLKPRLEERLNLLQDAAAASGGVALRASCAVLLAELGRLREVQDLLVDAWPGDLRPPEDLVLLYADRRLGERLRLDAVVTDALAGALESTNPYLWTLVVLEIRDDPERWGPDAEARVLSRWSDQPSGLDGTTIRSWAEVMSRELAAARRE